MPRRFYDDQECYRCRGDRDRGDSDLCSSCRIEQHADALQTLHEERGPCVVNLDLVVATDLDGLHRELECRDLILSMSSGYTVLASDYVTAGEVIEAQRLQDALRASRRPVNGIAKFVSHVTRGGNPENWKDSN